MDDLRYNGRHPLEVRDMSVAQRCTRGFNCDAQGKVNSLDGWKL